MDVQDGMFRAVAVLRLLLLAWGAAFGTYAWARGAATAHPASAGTVMLAGLPVILGVQLLLGFLQFDWQNVPRRPLRDGP